MSTQAASDLSSRSFSQLDALRVFHLVEGLGARAAGDNDDAYRHGRAVVRVVSEMRARQLAAQLITREEHDAVSPLDLDAL